MWWNQQDKNQDGHTGSMRLRGLCKHAPCPLFDNPVVFVVTYNYLLDSQSKGGPCVYLTTGQAAQQLQVTSETVRRLIEADELKASRLTPTGQYRILESDLREYAARRSLVLASDLQPAK
jgi:excisionase family DNA binding protein